MKRRTRSIGCCSSPSPCFSFVLRSVTWSKRKTRSISLADEYSEPRHGAKFPRVTFQPANPRRNFFRLLIIAIENERPHRAERGSAEDSVRSICQRHFLPVTPTVKRIELIGFII